MSRTRSLLVHASFALVLAGASGRAVAQPFLYALNETGTLSVNGTVLDKLSSSFDPSDSSDAEQRWWELFVLGSDRYALRIDGRLSSNGATLHDLPFVSIDDGSWVGLAVTEANVWALRTDGVLSRDGTSVIDYQEVVGEGEFFFIELAVHETHTYALRSDGAIFRDLVAEPLFQFVGGPGIDDAAEGKAPDTTWIDLAVDPATGLPYALRRDGKLVRGELIEGEISDGVLVSTLPFGDVLTSANAWVDVAFSDDARWYATRADGEIYDQDNQVAPLLDLPGSRLEDLETTCMEATGFGTSLLVLRWDGRIFDLSGSDALVNLTQSRYRNVTLSAIAPDLTNSKNAKPKLTRYTVAAVTGVPVTFPVLATDTDKDAADLVVTILPEDLPPGVVWDELLRTLTWDAPGPVGSYKIPVAVDDGVAPQPLQAKLTIKVRDPDDDPEKNKKPFATKIKTARALVGRELVLPILASDLDGDPLTITAATDVPPFTNGAVFDAQTATVTWTPSLADIGKYTLAFTIDDGTLVKKLKVKLEVVSSLLAL